MAWDNRRKEPKREWIEQILGLIVMFGWGGLSFWFAASESASWFPSHNDIGVVIGTVLMFVFGGILLSLVAIFAIGLWYIAHEIGEIFAALLKSIGLDPRPNPRERGY